MSELRFHEWTICHEKCGLLEPTQHILGSRYDPKLDVAEIAKQIRKLIKDAIKAGYLPKIKTSVRIQRFSGGQSINIEVKECFDDITTEAVVECVETLERFVKSYQRSVVELYGDYWEKNFYGHVSWCVDNRYADWRKSKWVVTPTTKEDERCPW